MKTTKIMFFLIIVALIVGCSTLGFEAGEEQTKVGSVKEGENEIKFKLEYNGEDQVYVAGSFNDWQATATPMEREGDYWIKEMELEPGEYQYKFVIEGEKWITDPNNPQTADDGYGGENSVINVGEGTPQRVEKKSEPTQKKTDSGLVEFKLEYNGEDQVYVAGSFNDWQATTNPMQREGDYWIKKMELEPGEYQYKFVIDGEKWITDPDNPQTTDDGYGGENSVITVGRETKEKETEKMEKAKIKESVKGTIPVQFKYEPLTGGKKEVYVAGDFNEWDPKATPLEEDKGIYKTTINLEPGKYQYKYVVDGKWVTDENADELVDDGYGGQNSVKIVGDLEEIEALHRVKFKYHPEKEVQNVYLAGSFNDWNSKATKMHKADDNRYEVTLLLKKGRYSYKFVVNGSQWVTDMSAAQFEDDGFGGKNSIIEVDDRFPRVVLEEADGKITTYGIPTEQSLQTVNPISKSKVEFKTKVYAGDVEKVYLNKGGDLLEMKKMGNDDTFDYYHVMVKLASPEEEFDYYFVLEDGKTRYYVMEGEVTEEVQPDKAFRFSFDVIEPFNTPDWVKKGIIYQIFCDRFYNGDKANDQDFEEWYYEGVNIPPPEGEYLPSHKEYYHFVDDWYNIEGLKDNPYRKDAKPDWWSFYGGDIPGVHEKLPYLEDLGVTIIYFNPLFEAKSNHKYDAADYMKLDPHFGTEEEFKAFVKDAHARGIKIILDCAFNHTGETFWAFQDCIEKGPDSEYWHWYEWKKWPLPQDPKPADYKPEEYYACWWGFGDMPDLNYDKSLSAGEENSIKNIENADPNRDVVNYILDVGEYWIKDMDLDGFRLDVPNEVPFWFWKLFNDKIKSIKPDAYLVGEIWGNATDWVSPEIFDAVMNYAFFKDPVMRFFAMKSCNAKSFEEDIQQGLLTYPTQVNQIMMNLIDSHDTHRFLETVNGNLNKMRLTRLFQMTFVGAPHIWYGDEIGMRGGHDPDCRRPFNWKYKNDPEKVALRNFVKKLISIRKQHDCLTLGQFKSLYAEGMVYSYLRYDDEESIVVVINNDDQENTVTIDTTLEKNQMQDLLTDKKYTLDNGKLKFTLPAMSGLILE